MVHGAQKQADYLTRYFTLLAASNALSHANWGALICHREGLIDDGLSDTEYPVLERICHYKNADGKLENYKLQPSFFHANRGEMDLLARNIWAQLPVRKV